jgi:hypothetical protein
MDIEGAGWKGSILRRAATSANLAEQFCQKGLSSDWTPPPTLVNVRPAEINVDMNQ